ncbi:MAG: hypothetical protein P8O03_05045, partial [Ilumatobacter sp.]|nr:hypothetical protein [Ilumatobacter sp.]
GDRIFIVAFDALRRSDIDVKVVSRTGALAPPLALRAMGHVHLLPRNASTLNGSEHTNFAQAS